MRNEKSFFIFLVLISSAMILFYFWGLRKEFYSASKEKKSSEAAVSNLQLKLEQLAEFRDSANKSEIAFKEELRREQEKVLKLRENLRKSASQSRSLFAKLSQVKPGGRPTAGEFQKKIEELAAKNEDSRKKLEEARNKFKLIEPLKEKISGVDSALSALEFKKGKEELLSAQLETISRELISINGYMEQLVKNNIPPVKKGDAWGEEFAGGEMARALPDEGEIVKIRNELGASERERAQLKWQYRDAQDQLAKAHDELNARAEKIFSLQEKVMNMENNLFEMQVNLKEMEKDSVILKEKYLAVELEKSGLQIALDQSRQELAQLQSKFLSLLGRIGGIIKSSDDARALVKPENSPRLNNTNIDVLLIPQGENGRGE